MNAKYLKISKLTFRKAYRSDKFMDGLILAIAIKAHYTNSIIYNYSPNKIRDLIGCNQNKAIECVHNGVECGLLKFINNNAGNTHLLATHLYNKEGKIVKVAHIESKAGTQLYLNSTEQDSDSINASKTKRQTYKDVKNLFLEIGLLLHIKGYDKMLNTFIGKKIEQDQRHLSESSRKHLEKTDNKKLRQRGVKGIRSYAKKMAREGKYCVFNTGYSYDAMSKHLKNKLSTKKIARLIKQLAEDKLINVYKNVVTYRNIKSDEDFDVINAPYLYYDEEGVDRFKKTYSKRRLTKAEKNKGIEFVLLRRMANTYEYTSSAISYGKDYKKIAIIMRNKKIEKEAELYYQKWCTNCPNNISGKIESLGVECSYEDLPY